MLRSHAAVESSLVLNVAFAPGDAEVRTGQGESMSQQLKAKLNIA